MNKLYLNDFQEMFIASANGMAFAEIVLNDQQKAIDYKFIEINSAFEKFFQTSRAKIINQLASSVFQTNTPPFLDTFAEVALLQKKKSFDCFCDKQDMHFHVSAFSTSKGTLTIVFRDITKQVETEKLLQISAELNSSLSSTDNIQLACNKIIDAILKAPSIDVAAMYIQNQKNRFFQLINNKGFFSSITDNLKCLRFSKDYTQYIVSNKQPVFTSAKDFDKLFPTASLMPSIHAVGYIPIICPDKVVAFLCIGSTSSKVFSKSIQYFIETILGNMGNILTRIQSNILDLKESEEEFRGVIEQASEGILVTDSQFKIIHMNKAFSELYEANASDFIGVSFQEFVERKSTANAIKEGRVDAFVNAIIQNIEKILPGSPLRFEERYTDSKGIPHVYAVNVFKIQLSNRHLITASVNDITDQKNLDSIKDRFVNMVSHEMRTPLLSITSSLELLDDTHIGTLNHNQMNLVNISKRNTKRLSNFVNHVIDFQKINDPSFRLSIETVSIHSILQTVVETMKPLAKDKSILLNYYPDNALPKIEIDKDQIQRLLINLVHNAIKYTNMGSVTVSTSVENNKVIIKVIDTGIGFKKGQVRALFSPFIQFVDQTDYARPESSGLGLCISKEIIRLHGGKITLSTEYQKGTTFTILLPFKHNPQ